MNPADATREVMWNINHSWLMYVLFVPTLAVAGYGIYRRVQSWRQGQPAARFDRPWLRIQRLVRHAIIQQATWRDRFAGAFHAMLFWGFITLTAATTVVFIHHDFNLPIMQGRFYLYFQSLFVDVFGVLTIVGALLALWRRTIVRPKALVLDTESVGLLALILTILVTGFLLEGWRIAATNDPWGSWSPAGMIVANVSSAIAGTETLMTAHRFTWWFHLVIAFGFLAWVPYTKLLHILTAPLNIYTANLDSPGGTLKTIDFETAESFGVNRLEQFTWKDLLDVDACTECGRCTAACPANRVGKLLSPRDLILDLQSLLRTQQAANDGANADGGESSSAGLPIVGATPALSAEALWECTSCAACVAACPVSIEQLPKIIDLRRFQVMEEADFPQTMQEAVTSMEGRGHPFRGTQLSRLDWTADLDVPHIEEVENPEVLLWVGCGGALVERNQRIVRALAQLLQSAGLRFAILGREETCTGDPARRIGQEFTFETLAKQNIETFAKHNVQTIVTLCPHCFNTMANEYPELGGRYEVFHHTTYLAKLIGAGRLKIDPTATDKLTFHDPCYLSRHNEITEPPRELLRRAASQPLVEMQQSRKESFCCGAGGGMSFVEEPADKRVNQERARQVLATGADTVATACPFCSTMMEDGLAAVQQDRKVRVKDIAEILWEAVGESTKT